MRKSISRLRDPKIFYRIVAGLIALVIVCSMLFFELKNNRVQIDDSLVEAPLIAVSPANAGTVNELDVYEGQHVKKGDTLAVVGTNPITAGTDAQIVTVTSQPGATVSQATQLLQMIDPTQMRIAGTIDENKGLSDVAVGQVASFTVDALPGQTFWGYVDEVSPSAKQTALSFSISTERPTQQFIVYVKFDAANYPQIKNGMSAKITVFTKT